MRAALAALFLLACTPQLDDGFYTCPDGACPSGWFCHSTGYCYTTEEGVLTAFGETCAAAEACETGFCDLGAAGTWSIGFCSRSCSSSEECPTGSGCSPWGTCLRLCASAAPCPLSTQCVGFYLERTTPVVLGACMPETEPVLAGVGAACAADPECEIFRHTCAMRNSIGLCARPCGEGFVCGANEACMEIGEQAPICLQYCSSDPECPPEAPICASPDGVSSVCVPDGWQT